MRSTYWRAEASDRWVLMLVKASRTSSTAAVRKPASWKRLPKLASRTAARNSGLPRSTASRLLETTFEAAVEEALSEERDSAPDERDYR